MFTYSEKIRVRYAETDKMGYVYYGNYATYYEVARTEALRSLGMSYKELEEQSIMLPVYKNESTFIKPARYDDLLTFTVFIREIPDVKFSFDYEVYNQEDDLINKGKTTLVFVDTNTGRPCPTPQVIIDLLEPYFN